MLRTLRTSAWLGWQIESNWTDPLFFFTFSTLQPIASVLILVFMYRAVSSVGAEDPIYGYIYVGNAFYIWVSQVMAGASYAILDDRERYRMLKYLYIAPFQIPLYLIGRAVARFVIGTLAVVITLGAGLLFFDVPIGLASIDVPLFAVTMVLGIASLVAIGIALGMWSLTLRSEPWLLGEGTAGAMYIFSGAIFPLSVLPEPLRLVGLALPVSYWLELLRRATLEGAATAFPTFAGYSDLELLGILAALTLVTIALAAFAFRRFDWVARERGMIDATSNF